jgi:hypothetical protein
MLAMLQTGRKSIGKILSINDTLYCNAVVIVAWEHTLIKARALLAVLENYVPATIYEEWISTTPKSQPCAPK